MTEPTQAAAKEREPQTAVAPLNTIDQQDIGASGAAFDRWLRGISNDYLTLERLTTVAGSLPVIGNIIALVDVIMDVIGMVDRKRQNLSIEFLAWVGLGINLIGVIPAPPTMGAARMSLRPALHLLKQKMKSSAANVGEALIAVLVTHLNDKIAGQIDNFVDEAMAKMSGVLDDCAKMADNVADDLIDVLNRCLGNKAMFDVPAPPETTLHDPQSQSRWNRMLAAASRAQKQAANKVASVASARLPDPAVKVLNAVIDKLTSVKTEFRGSLAKLADPNAAGGIQWLLKLLKGALLKHKASRSAALSTKGAEVQQNRPGHSLEATRKQAPAKKPCNRCKNKAPATVGGAISFATGCESFTHTDFVLQAALPIDWSRTYLSDLAAFDQGSLGARWITPYTTRVDVMASGQTRSLVYLGADGRRHSHPWLEVGQRHRDLIEEITLSRLSERLLTVDFGKPLPEGEPSAWRETYELVDTCAGKVATQGKQHFRLVSQHARDGAAIGLRYDHVVADGSNAGEEVLSDILSKQGDEILAHVGTQLDARTGRIMALWEIKDGQLLRQLAAYEHDEQGDLVVAQNEDAAAWRYTYQHHLITRYTDRTGRGMNLAYDSTQANARAIHEWANDGSFDVRLEWDKDIRLTYVTDAMGGETWVYYDILGYTYRIIHPDQREEWLFRDDAKNVTRHIHPDGTTDDYRYDADGNLQSHVRPDGSLVHFEYDDHHRLTGILDGEGGVWRREYDVQGHLVEQVDPRGLATQYTYDKAGRVVAITDAKGGTKKLSYGRDGQLTSYTDCSGHTSAWVHDARGRLQESIDAEGNSTRYRYTDVNAQAVQDAAAQAGNFPGQLETIVHADGSEERLVHDAEGRLLAHIDALERTTRYSYTAAGLIHQRTDALGQQLGYRWDKLGRLTELRNENDRAYRFQHDPVGRLLQERGFDDQLTTYRYDEATGVIAEVIDGEGEQQSLRTQVEFDPMGRLTERRASRAGQPEQSERFAYDANGRLVLAQNQAAKLQWFRDPAGNLVREHHHYLQEQHTAVWHHRYDELNQRVGTTRPDGHTLEWLSYGAGHVHGLLLDGQEVLGFERDGLHREVRRIQGNGLAQQQTYDPVGRLLEQTVASQDHSGPARMGVGAFKYRGANATLPTGPAAILRQYRYDKAGQLSVIGDSRRGQIEYRYDPVGQLLHAQSALGHETFAFDPAGNIAKPSPQARDRLPSSGPTGNKVLDNLLKEYAGTTYRYDDWGNLIERVHQGKQTTFVWDAFNRMSQASTIEGTTRFAYDPLGRRIAKCHEPSKFYKDTAAVKTLFGWDGDTLAFESTVREDAGLTASSVHYIHEPGTFVPLVQARRKGAVALQPTTDVKALMAANGGAYDIELDPLWSEVQEAPAPFLTEEMAFYQCDHLGTPQELTDHMGRIAWAAQYKAWGLAKEAINSAAQQAGFTNPIRFQGQYFDQETGLCYNRHRYYDPHSGRFVSKDPIGLGGGNNLQQ